MEVVFAVLLGVAGLWALWNAIRAFRTSTVAGIGFLVVAGSALIQILNLFDRIGGAYSVTLSIVTTAGLLLGYWLTRRGAIVMGEPAPPR
jgi:hypothetical protein